MSFRADQRHVRFARETLGWGVGLSGPWPEFGAGRCVLLKGDGWYPKVTRRPFEPEANVGGIGVQFQETYLEDCEPAFCFAPQPENISDIIQMLLGADTNGQAYSFVVQEAVTQPGFQGHETRGFVVTHFVIEGRIQDAEVLVSGAGIAQCQTTQGDFVIAPEPYTSLIFSHIGGTLGMPQTGLLTHVYGYRIEGERKGDRGPRDPDTGRITDLCTGRWKVSGQVEIALEDDVLAEVCASGCATSFGVLNKSGLCAWGIYCDCIKVTYLERHVGPQGTRARVHFRAYSTGGMGTTGAPIRMMVE